MAENALKEKEQKPNDGLVAEKLGAAFSYWGEIRAYAADVCGATTEEWKYYGVKYGWQLKTLLKKRNLFFLIPCESCFRVVFVFGDRAVGAIEESNIAESLKEEIRSAKKYLEGRGIAIDVEDGTHIPDIKTLMEIKIKN